MNKFKLTAVLFASCILFGAYAQGVDAKAGSSQSLKFAEMSGKKEKENYFVIDVREPNEYAAGHVRYAINISVNEIEKRINEISDLKDKNVVVICQTGNRSGHAAKILKMNGFTSVFNAKGMRQYKYTAVTKTPNIRGKDLQKAADDGAYFIIDARDEKDYAEGRLKGAVNITLDTLDKKMSEIPKDRPIAVYCYSGNRSFELAERLTKAGFKAVSSLDGSTEYAFTMVK